MNNHSRISILVCCHKNFARVQNQYIQPIAVGVASNGNELDIELCDNSCKDNISHLNPSFCELTAMYHAYKNIQADYYGLFHYRRYFSLKHIGGKVQEIQVKGISDGFESGFGLDCANIKSVLDSFDLVVQRPFGCTSVYRQYKVSHNIADLDFCLNYIDQNYPQMSSAAQSYMQSKQAYLYNMFVAKQSIFFDYCKFLFDVIFAFDAQKDYSGYDAYQKRTPGFLAERLFGIYITYITKDNPSLRVLHAPIVFIKKPFDTSPYKIKQEYKTPLSKSLINSIAMRGTKRRELLKKIYRKLKK